MEPRHGHLGRVPNRGPDLHVTCADFGKAYYDFTVVDEMAATYAPTRPENRTAAAANAAERVKRESRDAAGRAAAGERYAGLAVEQGGALGPALVDFYCRLGEHVGNPGHDPRGWHVPSSRAVEMTSLYDNPAFTAPTITQFHIQRLSLLMRKRAVEGRRICARRLGTAGPFGARDGGHRPRAGAPAHDTGRGPPPSTGPSVWQAGRRERRSRERWSTYTRRPEPRRSVPTARAPSTSPSSPTRPRSVPVAAVGAESPPALGSSSDSSLSISWSPSASARGSRPGSSNPTMSHADPRALTPTASPVTMTVSTPTAAAP